MVQQTLPPSSKAGAEFLDKMLSCSWPAATAPSRARLQPPRAPLRRPSTAPMEVLPLELPISPTEESPRLMSRGNSNSSFGEDACGDRKEIEEEEQLIFALDGLEGK